MPNKAPEAYWEHAGEVSYASAMFSHSVVERHVNQRLWQIGIDIGRALGLTADATIMDLGCGDGTLSNTVLAQHYKCIDGFDLSAAAIKRAQSLAPRDNIHFDTCDITQTDFANFRHYDGTYLWGILHHVKAHTPHLLKRLARITKHVVVLEPNGDHLLRKLLEKTATYKAAGEDSFKTKELSAIFNTAGFEIKICKRLNLFPNFTPKMIFHMLKRLEPMIEQSKLLRALCTVNMWGLTSHV